MVYTNYKWKEGSRIALDPELAGKELNDIGKTITPEDVIEKAREESTELHKGFEWDDEAAAQALGLPQARMILNSLVLVVERQDLPPDDAGMEIRVYENVRLENSERVYMPTKTALKTPDLREQVMGRLVADIEQAERTAENYEYLIGNLTSVKENLKKAKELIRA